MGNVTSRALRSAVSELTQAHDRCRGRQHLLKWLNGRHPYMTTPRNVQEAARGTEQVTGNIGDVRRGAGETGAAASQVRNKT
jgi:hypothetical protein